MRRPLSGSPCWVHLEGSKGIHPGRAMPAFWLGYLIGSLVLPGLRVPGLDGGRSPGDLVTGNRDPSVSPTSGVSRCPLSTLTVHPDHCFQRADGVEVGFLLPAFF